MTDRVIRSRVDAQTKAVFLVAIPKKVEDHPFFGMHKKSSLSVAEEMDQLRGGRYKRGLEEVV